MRKPRAIVIDDDDFIRSALRRFFVMRGHEVLPFNGPAAICAVDGSGGDFCADGNACGDIFITDIHMPGVNGVELLECQARKGCRLNTRNKAVISGCIDPQSRKRVQRLGSSCFEKPFTLDEITAWVAGCEQRLDLNRPLATRRREERFGNCREVTFTSSAGGDVHSGATVNVSPSGLCLKLPAPLAQAQTLRVQGSHFPSCRPATVRWVSQIGTDVFLAGLHCS
jgi:CheY-like chemotaxis protein